LRAEALTTKSSPDFSHYLIYFDLFSATYLSETKVIEKAKILCGYVLDCNTNSTNQQKHDKKEKGFYKLKQEFIEAAKDELSELKKLSN
jgi:hypothetical protein